MTADRSGPPRRPGLLATRLLWIVVAVFTIALIAMVVVLTTGTQT